MVMLNDLIEQRPDVHRGWLEAELDAQLYMLDPANADDVASMAEAQTEQIDKDVLKHSLFGGWPENQGGGEVKVQLDFIVTERVQGAARRRDGVPVQPAEEAGCRRDDS